MVLFFARKQMNIGTGSEVTARRFVVLDSAGDPVATLGSTSDGAIPALVLMPSIAAAKDSQEAKKWFEENLRPMAEKGGSVFFATQDESAVLLGGRKGRHETEPDFGGELSGGREDAHLYLNGQKTRSGVATVVLSTSLDQGGVTASAPSGRFVSLNASDPNGIGGLEVPGSASVTLSDSVEPSGGIPPEAEFKLLSDKSASLEFAGEKWRTQAGFYVDKDGSPHLDLYDSDGNLRAVLGSANLEVITTGESQKTAPSSLTMFDKKGKLIGRLPP